MCSLYFNYFSDFPIETKIFSDFSEFLGVHEAEVVAIWVWASPSSGELPKVRKVRKPWTQHSETCHNIMLCFAMLCYAMLCYALLYSPCFTMLYYITLYYTIL